jgi:hypothetical protein
LTVQVIPATSLTSKRIRTQSDNHVDKPVAAIFGELVEALDGFLPSSAIDSVSSIDDLTEREVLEIIA